MRVVGFIGPSGTGKSYRALSVAISRGIEYIIDDGLLIKGNRIVAGVSAKKESTRIGSIKRALFIYDEHVEEVKKAIDLHKPESILILGTSEGMVDKIVENLGLPKISEKVYIHEIANDLEINQALSVRKEQGKHVIPVPTFEIKKDFSGYFLDPLQIFRRKSKGRLQLVAEKSIVRPTFSYMGKYIISDYTIYQIAEHVILEIKGVSRISRFKVENNQEGIIIDIDLTIIYGYPIRPLLENIQKKVRYEIEKLTGLNIKALNLYAKNLIIQNKESY
ncbi:MAG TPA: Asp23/Gls24 family envelope stress response protein [Clostridiaceae bacterium]|nr:Asp23/Gls24 family envelope stress response protein [Clostridiaceae bacterium]